MCFQRPHLRTTAAMRIISILYTRYRIYSYDSTVGRCVGCSKFRCDDVRIFSPQNKRFPVPHAVPDMLLVIATPTQPRCYCCAETSITLFLPCMDSNHVVRLPNRSRRIPRREKSLVAYHLTLYFTNIKSRRAQHIKHRLTSTNSERVIPPSTISSTAVVGVVHTYAVAH